MDSLKLTDLASILKGDLRCHRRTGRYVRHASIHSDHIRHGTAFFALPGRNSDGHRYVDRALHNGAVVAVVAREQLNQISANSEPVIAVANPKDALQGLAEWWRSQLSAEFIAVVGNIGKTITKDALVHFVGYEREVYGSPGSYNSQLGVPLSILECPRDTTIAVIEAAATKRTEMVRLRNIIRPTYAVLTNIGTRWESDFGGSAEQANEIAKIASEIPNHGWLLSGDDTPLVRRAVSECLAAQYFLGHSGELPSFSTPEHNLDRITTTVEFLDGTRMPLNVRTPSEHIATDVYLAMAAAYLLGISVSSLIDSSQDYLPTFARMELWRSPDGITVIRDIATADGTAITGAVSIANRLAPPGRHTTIVLADAYDGCGDNAAAALGRTIGRAGINRLYATTTSVHRLIVDGAHAINTKLEAHQFSSVQEMRQHLLSTLQSGDVVLMESPRDRTIAELSQNILEPMSLTRLYIDQSALGENVAWFRRLVGADVRLMAAVKGLAYGTNPIQMSICLEAVGVDALMVATTDEGVALRKAGISVDTILVALATEDEIERISRNRLTPLIYSPHMLEAILRHAEKEGPTLQVHCEVDTGMHRTGFSPDDTIKALRRLSDIPSIKLTGLMTHFGCADIPDKDEFTLRQLSLFEHVVSAAHDLGYTNLLRHAANTAATIRLPSTRLDMVRIGIGLFGICPSAETAQHADLTPAVSLISQIVEIHELAAGDSVGYGATFQASAAGQRIAVVPAGYHDCVPRALSNHGVVMVNGHACPIVGVVSMDSMTIDITHCPDASVGSDVVIYGQQGTSVVSIEDVAQKLGTIPYELLACIGPRVQRVFTRH